ncbi:HNH endonuclease [Nitratireductor aquimarinus]|uniref:HNH endonuclease n=1 Tax=Nitratireductor TaxID=245876 RepID=UPI0019D32010|nr:MULTISPECIES: HNH endonuclease signature motif containing protein [Nitratireductor]MBN7776794.1 HNH endonuclease [Nitratireductor pacificus]MBN7780128.1 HNH endonuclease [Nitratireductor pacificus]MBN7788935.1 HNH endonuclease [Nitratireductor aquimarinus]MBY6099003.1 HNH endonuclease [Nitratireductor aquimarinus]MCA1259337.1 HNH endonuclease [Nitratireductor aquimarinus]
MWAVQRPDIDTAETFDECAALIRNANLRARMQAIRPTILVLSADYDKKAQSGQLHLIDSHEAGVNNVACADLMKNYTLRMARKGVPARAVYDALKILPKNNRCPLCGYGPVETLDHILPKRLYPGFSVKPTNLVGCCDRCNRLKSECAPTGPEDGFLHPYFENVNEAIWLVAEIVPSAPAAAMFQVDQPPNLDDQAIARVRAQFERLELARLYSDAAADEIVDIQESLEAVFDAVGAEGVAEHLRRQCRSRRRANRNSWRAALYDALAASEWYCEGGFRNAG